MNRLPGLFANNRRWGAGMEARQRGFFGELSALQYAIDVLGAIGSADARG